MASAIYSALPDNSTRLVTIQPGRREDPIKVSIEVVDLTGNTRYEALSYVWGPPDVTSEITCENQPFTARTNLVAALRRLRNEDTPRRVWIDAICINQTDNAERAAQVARMGDIYKGATRVLMWMGESAADERAAAGAWWVGRMLLDVLRETINSLGEAQRALETIQGRLHVQAILKNDIVFNNNLALLRQFFGNEYFERVWTFQEVYLARKPYVLAGQGNVEFDFVDVVSAFLCLLERGIRLDLKGIECARTLMATCWWEQDIRLGRRSELPPEQRLRMSTILRSTYAHKASDARDRIFGMLAMTEQPGRRRSLIKPDYSLSVSETYLRTAKLLIEDDNGLQILSDAQGPSQRDPELPTWVPDWRVKTEVRPLGERTRDFLPEYRLNMGFEPPQVMLPCEDERRIRVRGAKLGTICEARCGLYDLFQDLVPSMVKRDWRGALAAPRERFNLFTAMVGYLGPLRRERYQPTDEPAYTAFVKTISADDLPSSCRGNGESQVKEYYPEYATYSTTTWQEAVQPHLLESCAGTNPSYGDDSPFAATVPGGPVKEVDAHLFATGPLTRWILLNDNEVRNRIEEVYLGIAKDIARAIETRVYGRIIFVTDRGYIGLGPEDAKEGDEVYDLLGGEVPFVLRRTHRALNKDDRDEKEFGLVGDCYVHGIMDGQLWKEEKDRDGEVMGLESVDGSLEWENIVLI